MFNPLTFKMLNKQKNQCVDHRNKPDQATKRPDCARLCQRVIGFRACYMERQTAGISNITVVRYSQITCIDRCKNSLLQETAAKCDL